MKEKVEQSPWTVMKFEEKEDVISKRMIEKYNFVIVKDDMVSYEECMQPVYQTIEEIGDGESLMLCSDQYKRRMLQKISIGTSESHVFKSNGLCMIAGIEEHLDDMFMQVDKEMKHRMDALEKKNKIRIGPLTEEYVHYC